MALEKPKLIAVVGPTATGKSKVAFTLAEEFSLEIVSADSMQVYEEMDIGTSKPSKEERARVRHHLVDMIRPLQDFNVAKYQTLARAAISSIQQQGKPPLLVGGSGLYIRAIIDKLFFPDGCAVLEIRQQLKEQAREKSLYEVLSRLDPEAARKIGPKNERRIIRALEVMKLTGRPFSAYQTEWNKRESIYALMMFGLFLPRQELYARINVRVDEMISKGFLNEVRRLRARSRGLSLTARQALGYRQILDYLDNEISWEETVELIKRKTRQFAKRQLTWFRRDPRIRWIDVGTEDPLVVIRTSCLEQNFLK